MSENDSSPAALNPYVAPPSSLSEPEVVTSDDFASQQFQPFRTIWLQPRRTVRRIVAENPSLHVVLLVCLAGVGGTLDRASRRNAGDEMSLPAILALACVFGPVGSLLSLWIGSHLIRLSGTWIGGAGVREHIKTAIAWASVPAVFALPLWIPQILLFGSDMFTEETPRLAAQPVLLVPLLVIALAEFVLGVWSFILVCNTVAEVQGFRSAWRGLGNLVLAVALIMVPLIFLGIGMALVLSA